MTRTHSRVVLSSTSLQLAAVVFLTMTSQHTNAQPGNTGLRVYRSVRRLAIEAVAFTQGRIQSLSLGVGGAEPISSVPPLPSPPATFLPRPPSFPSRPSPSLSFPSLLPFPSPPSPPLPSLPLPSPSLEEGVRGPSPENFEILDCCR